MNVNAILKPIYGDSSDFPTIAKDAAMYSKNPGITEERLLRYIEKKYERPPQFMRKQPVPYSVFGRDIIDYNAFDQMNTVCSIPVAMEGALMPDAHQGYAMPIGGVVKLHNAISPSFIGYDISCMVKLSMYNIRSDDLDYEFAADMLEDSTSFGLGSSTKNEDHEVMDDDLWKCSKFVQNLQGLARTQLGSSGGGNHFADIVEADDRIGLLTHSGSRGTGHKIAKHYGDLAKKNMPKNSRVPSGYEWIPMDTDLGREYFMAMTLMNRYAIANHEVIHRKFAHRMGVWIATTISNAHNLAWVHGDTVIHRKGATPAEMGVTGIIPGTCGTNSYLVRGLGNEESLSSSSHGAGRPYSRTMAKSLHDDDLFASQMSGIIYRGVAPDETPSAYKDIEEVMSRQTSLVEIITPLKPRVVIMGGQSDDGD